MKRTVMLLSPRSSDALLSRLNEQLSRRKASGKLRSLQKVDTVGDIAKADFSSNDYLGISRNKPLARRIEQRIIQFIENEPICQPLLGSTGSRLLTGNHRVYEDTEKFLAEFHNHSHCILSNSGWDLNFGILSCLPSKDSAVIYDELSHNSLIMGIRSGRQHCAVSFDHNDMNNLRKHLRSLKDVPEKVVVVESVYSMDGDICPLKELLDICEEFNAMALVDEAHSTGVYGDRGEGLVTALNLTKHSNLLGVVHTFGKGVGLHGAALLTAHQCIIGTLLNYCRPLIYSTSLSLSSILAVQPAYEEIASASEARKRLFSLISLFRSECENAKLDILQSTSPIQAVLFPGNHAVVQAAARLREKGFLCLPIRAPTVPEGSERLRIIIHAHNTEEEVIGLCRAIAEIKSS
jgi:8-amino-7-oxononanoate synthase